MSEKLVLVSGWIIPSLIASIATGFIVARFQINAERWKTRRSILREIVCGITNLKNEYYQIQVLYKLDNSYDIIYELLKKI